MKHLPLLLLILIAGILPFSASAATVAPTCAVAVRTQNGQVWPMLNGKIFLLATPGEPFNIIWASANASSAHTETGASIALTGYQTYAVTKTTSYSYIFESGGVQSACNVTAVVLQGTGSANRSLTTVPANTASVSSANSKDAILTASSLPLLTGGYAAPGASVPVAYLKLVNTSTSVATVHGVWLQQNGSADTSAVIGFSTVDDKGMNRTTLGGEEGTTPFKDDVAYVPLLNATLAPGQLRIFTIKAQLSKALSSSLGSTLMIDVSSLDTAAEIKSDFPIRGTTWMLRAY